MSASAAAEVGDIADDAVHDVDTADDAADDDDIEDKAASNVDMASSAAQEGDQPTGPPRGHFQSDNRLKGPDSQGRKKSSPVAGAVRSIMHVVASSASAMRVSRLRMHLHRAATVQLRTLCELPYTLWPQRCSQ